MAIATVAAIIGGAAAVAGGLQSRKAAKASAAAARSRAAIARLENARSRRQQVREFAIQRGTAVAQAATRGGGGGFGGVAGSAVQGQVAGLATQLKSNLAFLEEASRLGEQASAQEVRAVRAQGTGALFSGLSSAAFATGGLFKE